MNAAQKQASDIATCHCCLLAENMRGCKTCKFNVGLAADTTPNVSIWQIGAAVVFGSAARFEAVPEVKF